MARVLACHCVLCGKPVYIPFSRWELIEKGEEIRGRCRGLRHHGYTFRYDRHERRIIFDVDATDKEIEAWKGTAPPKFTGRTEIGIVSEEQKKVLEEIREARRREREALSDQR